MIFYYSLGIFVAFTFLSWFVAYTKPNDMVWAVTLIIILSLVWPVCLILVFLSI